VILDMPFIMHAEYSPCHPSLLKLRHLSPQDLFGKLVL